MLEPGNGAFGAEQFVTGMARIRWALFTMVPLNGMIGPRFPGRVMQALAILACMSASPVQGQVADGDSLPEPTCKRCLPITLGAVGVGMTGAFVVLDKAWYAGYDRAPMHSFDDGDEWLQMDKAAHAFNAYTITTLGKALVGRCGTSDRTATWAGAGMAMAFLTGVELLDGTSAAWGFSWWDMAANTAGTATFVGQDLLWGEQRMRIKFSAHTTRYAAMRPELLGSNLPEQLLKDYNGHTFWLSANPWSFQRESRLPPWLNVAFGYGARGMITATPPASTDALGGDLPRYRRFFLSPDIDLTRIRTRSKAVRTLLFVANSIKVPLPTLEYRGNGTWHGHWLYF
jgi:uncharacterized protein YfiM (DUF2279 family)